MSVDIKVAADEKLQLVQTYFNDNSPSSDFFNITELPDTLSGGKNAFLIAGSDKLFPQSEVKVQVRDAAGNVCYVEYADGNPEYFEGISKVVAIYVYPNETAFGPATITILGQAIDVPEEWKFRYNVKWQRQININPSLPNTTRVRFYKRPKVEIVESLQPIYRIESGSKVESGVTASFANIKISQLETFAGDVKRIKVFRTSEGDISDFDLIQDILIESKELLTTFDITSSVKGNAGIFTNETIKLWNTGSLTAALTNDRLDNGLRLSGSGIFKYNSPLSFVTKSTYELNLDAFYSSSTNSNLGVYISGSNNGIQLIGTLEGTIPVKNLEDTYFTFDVDKNEPTASLYLSQSQTEWHVANVSLKLSEDTAFSPNQIDFITTMPTVIGNETYNFKFEFYDVNNNYVPVAVTQSALFSGGNNNIGGTIILISGSTSASTAAILALSQSVSGTIGVVTGSINTVSASVSTVSSSLSSSISTSLSSSYYYTDLLSSSLSASQFSASAFQYSYSAYLDANIFTDENGKIKRPPTASASGLYTGDDHLGFYSGGEWRTYMDNQGDFYLTSSAAGGGFLAWDSANKELAIAGNITILGGDAATTTSLNSATASLSASAYNAFASASAYSASISASTFFTTNLLDGKIFTDSTGKIVKPPTNTASNYGLYLGSEYLGFYSGSRWRTYMDNLGKFYLTGSITDGYSNYLTWDGAGTLTIAGSINITGGNAATQAYAGSTASGSLTTATARLDASSSILQGNITTVDTKVFTDSTGRITKAPSTGVAGLFLGSSFLGFHDGSGTALGWKTYMANNGNFFLTGSNAWLKWDSSAGTLDIKGSINITGGNAATTTDFTYALTNANTSSISAATNAASYALQNANTSSINSLDNRIFNDINGKINKVATPSGAGLFLDSSKLGYYAGSTWKTFMSSSGLFYLTGSAGGNALLWDGNQLSIYGSINVTGGNAVTDTALSDGLSTKYDSSNPSGYQNNTSAKTGGSVGSWTITGNTIENNLVTIDNANSRIDFRASALGPTKTRIKAGNANIGSTATTTITLAAGTETISDGSPPSGVTYYGIFTKSASSGGNTAEVSLTAPAGTTGNTFSIVVPYPSLPSVGYVKCDNLGGGTSWQYSYYARLDYVVRLNNSSGTAVASGYKNLIYEDWGIQNTSPGDWTIDGFGAGTITIPNIAAATEGQVYWVSVTLNTNASVRVNPQGGIVGAAAYLYARSNGWDAYPGNAILLAVAARAEYATNGAQIGSSEGTYVAFGDAAGSGFVGQFAGNVQIIGVLSAGSITTSDKRAKTNVKQIQNGIQTIKKLNPVSYDWLQHVTGNNEFKKGYGFIADDIENVLPDLVYKKRGYQFDDFKHLEYNSFHAIAIKAIQELVEKVEKLEAQISGSK